MKCACPVDPMIIGSTVKIEQRRRVDTLQFKCPACKRTWSESFVKDLPDDTASNFGDVI